MSGTITIPARGDEPLPHSYWASRVEAGTMTVGSAARYTRVFAAFRRFIVAHGCHHFSEVDGRLCSAFVYAPQRDAGWPAVSTSRFRLTVVRDAYAALILAGTVSGDPTEGLRVLQVTQARRVNPLSPAEVARLRSAGRIYPRDHLRPTAVELALLGASHMEIARAVVGDANLSDGQVRLGSRWANLDPFASATLIARIAACRQLSRRQRREWDPDRTALALSRPITTYPELTVAPGISSALSRAMTAAGLTRTGVRPSSIREFAANRAYALSGRVESVAQLLGLDSLDVSLGFIDFTWQDRYADEVRG